MSVYRSRVRLYADVLRAVRDGAGDEGFARISAVMRKANTSYAKLSGILDELAKSSMLEIVESGDVKGYRLTEIGLKFLDEYERLERFAKAYGLRL
ncbi:MAG: winged helix-turn-helix domain-containing protein [Nitrososphaeria archaeon]|jgi:predicted transcriptional regulator